MSHEIVAGVDTMVLAEQAWHGLGTVIGRTVAYAEALSLAGLDWTVELAPITTLTRDGIVEVPSHRASVRADTGAVLGVVGADYCPHQPAEVLDLARLTIDAAPDDNHLETLGSLRGNRVMFATIALPGEISVAGDVHLPRLVWATSFDGTLATRAVVTMVRVVCANTLRASFAAARTCWSARHTASLSGRVADARAALQLVTQVSASFQAEVEALTTRPLTDRDVETVLGRLFPDQPDATIRARSNAADRRTQVRHLYRHDPRVGWHGTGYGLVQAVSTWELWHSPRRGQRGEQAVGAVIAGTKTLAVDTARLVGTLT